MDLKSMVEIGGKVEIILEKEHFKDLKGFSMIQDVTHTGELIITLPMFEGRPIILNPKDNISIFFFREEGSFCFHGEVTERFKIKNVVMITIRQNSSIRKIQRRQYFRLKVVLPVKFTIMNEGEETENSRFEGFCTDISGRGLRLNTDCKLDVNTIINCSINLGNEKQILVKGKITRTDLSDGLTYKYDMGVSFQDISHRMQESLIKFIFNKQRELRKKGFI